MILRNPPMSTSALQQTVAQLRGRFAGTVDDRELLERFLAEQDQDAFATLVSRHQRLVLSAVRKVLREPADVEDAFQATFLVLLRKARQVRWQAGLGTWLYAVAHRIAVHSRAAQARRANRITSQTASQETSDLSCSEACLLLHQELDRLGDQYRLPLLLCYLEGKSRDEAARQLGVPLSTVKGRLEQGRNLLRRRLLRRGVTLSVGLLGTLGTSPALSAASDLVARTVSAALGDVPARVSCLVQEVTALMILNRVKLFGPLVALVAITGLLVPLYAFPTEKPAPAPVATAPDARETHKDQPQEANTLTGKVVGPDNKPIKGARVHLHRSGRSDKESPSTQTADDGRFKLHVPNLTDGVLIARAPGLGADWVSIKPANAAGRELTLRMVSGEIAIEGRLLDLEGLPIADAQIRIADVGKPHSDNLDTFLNAWKNPERAMAGGPLTHEMPAAAVVETVTTRSDRQGRFRLTGIGNERQVSLHIQGKGIATQFVSVITRQKLPDGAPRWMKAATFQLIIPPGKVMYGTVRERGSGKPLADIEILGQAPRVRSNDRGEFRIEGMNKSSLYFMTARGTSHFSTVKEVKDTAALDPIKVDFEMERGLPLEGQLRERGSGKPVQGVIEYAARADNEAVKGITGRLQQSTTSTGADGRFRLLVLPGAGYLQVQANENRFCRADLPGWKGDLIAAVPHPVFPHRYHAVVAITAEIEKPESLKHTIELNPGVTLKGTIVDPDGKPLTGVSAFGLTAIPDPGARITPRPARFGPPPPAQLPSATFTVIGLDVKTPRHLVFVHATKKLGKVIRVRGDEKEPLTVRLEPMASVTGTLHGKEDMVKAGYIVLPSVSRRFVDYFDYPIDLLDTIPRPFNRRPDARSWLKTTSSDDQGKFRVEGLIPGLKYELMFATAPLDRGGMYVNSHQVTKIEAGKTIEIGVCRVR
jgi:RNA polymerase sigma factor (sigma-70 family)